MIRSVYLPTLLFAAASAVSSAFADDAAANRGLSIAVLQGGGATNNLQTGAVTVPVVEVRDESLKPVAGAEVTFTLPGTGPGGTFPGGAAVARAKTNSAGQARPPEFVPSREEGRFFIDVTARLGERAGTTRIAQSNSTKTFSSGVVERERSKFWKVLAVAGGGAVTAGLIVLSRTGGGGGGGGTGASTSGPPSITLTPGPITVGGPR